MCFRCKAWESKSCESHKLKLWLPKTIKVRSKKLTNARMGPSSLIFREGLISALHSHRMAPPNNLFILSVEVECVPPSAIDWGKFIRQRVDNKFRVMHEVSSETCLVERKNASHARGTTLWKSAIENQHSLSMRLLLSVTHAMKSLPLFGFRLGKLTWENHWKLSNKTFTAWIPSAGFALASLCIASRSATGTQGNLSFLIPSTFNMSDEKSCKTLTRHNMRSLEPSTNQRWWEHLKTPPTRNKTNNKKQTFRTPDTWMNRTYFTRLHESLASSLLAFGVLGLDFQGEFEFASYAKLFALAMVARGRWARARRRWRRW